jgi:hypothetical protein
MFILVHDSPLKGGQIGLSMVTDSTGWRLNQKDRF